MVLRFDDLTESEKKRIDVDNVIQMMNNDEYRLLNGFCSYGERQQLKEQIIEYSKMINYAERYLV